MIGVLYGILSIAVLADLATKRIPNALILFGLLAGFVFQYMDKGPPGLASCIMHSLLAFALYYLFYKVGALGAGDVKLILVITSFLGVKMSTKILVVSLLFGGAYGCIKMLISSIKSQKIDADNECQKNSHNIDLKQMRKNLKSMRAGDIQYLLLVLTSKMKEDFGNNIKNSKLTKFRYSPAIMLATYFVWKGLV